VKKAELEKKKKEAEEANLPEEERNALNIKKEAEVFKNEGTEFYKARNFEKALELYQKAIDKCPIEMTYHSNKAAVFFEMKKYEDCI
jgi:stress-induced-phosphoprotein 1